MRQNGGLPGPPPSRCVDVYYCRTYVKAVRGGGSEERGRVLWDATSRGLFVRVGPPRTIYVTLLDLRRVYEAPFPERAGRLPLGQRLLR